MHESSLLRMQWFVDTYLDTQKSASVLDVGSYDVNGSYKQFFTGPRFTYTGLDMVSGPNVDYVLKNPYQWEEFPDAAYDVVVSGQTFEHTEFFWLTLAEMARVLRPGGYLCIIVPRCDKLHRYPVDCYRFDTDGMIALARYCNLSPLHASTDLAPKGASSQWYNPSMADSMLVAAKPQGWNGIVNPATYTFHETDLEQMATGFIRNPAPPPTSRKVLSRAWRAWIKSFFQSI